MKVMATSSLRREVLKSFKEIHKTRLYIFQGDVVALTKAREEINEHYKKNKTETNEDKIKDLIKLAYDVVHELKTSIVQLEEVNPGKFHVHLRPELLQDEISAKKINKKDIKKCTGK